MAEIFAFPGSVNKFIISLIMTPVRRPMLLQPNLKLGNKAVNEVMENIKVTGGDEWLESTIMVNDCDESTLNTKYYYSSSSRSVSSRVRPDV